MKQIARRLSALEEQSHPQQVHVITFEDGVDGQSAIDTFGRDRIRSTDLVVLIKQFGSKTEGER